MLTEEVHLIFYGEVQGVGFRAKAKQLAHQLHLLGYARNLANGSVEVCAQGRKDVLNTFISMLREQFRIERVTIVFRPMTEAFTQFMI